MERTQTPEREDATNPAADKAPQRLFKSVNCTTTETWEAYLACPDPARAQDLVQRLSDLGKTVSVAWARKKIRLGGFAKRRRFLMATQADPDDFNELKVRDLLVKSGKNYNPLLALSGLQSRITAVPNQQLPMRHEPEYFVGMTAFYSKITDELHRTYQYQMQAGAVMTTSHAAKQEPGETVTPFRKRSDTNIMRRDRQDE